MKKSFTLKILSVIMCLIFGVTFSIGIFGNPNFNIHDFCLNLSSEIFGILITVVLVDSIIKAKAK